METRMEAVNSNDNPLPVENVRTSSERIATLEERSQHAATKAELHRSLMTLFIAILTLFIALLTALGGLIIHLHNTTLNEISEIRQLLISIVQQLPGG